MTSLLFDLRASIPCLRVKWTWWQNALFFRYRFSSFSETGEWPAELNIETKCAIEKYWSARFRSEKYLQQWNDSSSQKYYVLSMFPYPSGHLHMGHVRVYSISDAMARFYRMRGKDVIHPMGWDAFGLPAENAAIERGVQPDVWTYSNIANMREQLNELCCSFDWNREFATCDPTYYKWTQYLFLKMFECGLAYQEEALVNWDPVDETVLADEQVDERGCSWRSGVPVEKKWLKQWFLKTTVFSQSLRDGLNDPVLEKWRDIKKIQDNWIGECDGSVFEFQLMDENGHLLNRSLRVWTSKPEAIFGATFITLTSDHVLNTTSGGRKGCDEAQKLDIRAVHPFTGTPVPIFVCDAVAYPENNSVYLGIPGAFPEAMEFAERKGLDIIQVFDSPLGEEENHTLLNSKEFSGMGSKEARDKICAAAQRLGCGGHRTSSKLRDWLISRQRYWGTPIPIIHCPKCKVVPVPYSSLPVVLPKIDNFCGKGTSPLKSSDWKNVSCPKCGRAAERETDTMDTFVDSSWYYLRYLDPTNDSKPFDRDLVDRNMPVDIYIGGKEHAALHLYYARYVHHFCHQIGLTPHKEPFRRLLVQGMVMGQTFKTKRDGRYLKKEEVEQRDKKWVEKESQAPVIVQWEKMSKSHHNGVDPKEVILEYGADTTRLFILADAAPTSNRNWPATTFPGLLTWQRRLWLTIKEFLQLRRSEESSIKPISSAEFQKHEDYMFDSRNYYLKGVTHNFQDTFQLSVAISKLQGFTNSIRRAPPAVVRNGLQYERALAVQIIMLSPITPCFASELWAGFVSTPIRLASDIIWDRDVLAQNWPELDMTYNLELVVKVNDEEVHAIKVPRKILDHLVESEAMAIIQKDVPDLANLHFEGLTPVKSDYSLIPGYEAEVNFYIPGWKVQKKKSGKKFQSQIKTSKSY